MLLAGQLAQRNGPHNLEPKKFGRCGSFCEGGTHAGHNQSGYARLDRTETISWS
jgi:hypothetical protein